MTSHVPPPLPPLVQLVQSAITDPALKPGFKSSEFLAVVLAAVSVNYQAQQPCGSLEDRITQIVAMLGTVLMVMAYSKQRAAVKESVAARQQAQEGQQ